MKRCGPRAPELRRRGETQEGNGSPGRWLSAEVVVFTLERTGNAWGEQEGHREVVGGVLGMRNRGSRRVRKGTRGILDMAGD